MAREIIYIDVDDEITSVINKLDACKGKVVALVPPKHAAVLSSAVNLKLLKRAAESSKKSIVLITNEPNIILLAGIAQLHIAKSLKSKPILPKAPAQDSDADVFTSDDLDKVSPTAASATATEEIIELDNTVKAAKTTPLTAFNKKLKVPNFNTFRLKMFGGIGLVIVLIVGAIFAFIIMPKATVTLTTEVSTVDAAMPLTLNTAVQEFDENTPVLPATLAEKKVNDSEKVPATGKKDVGEKASGSVKMINCNKDDKLSDTIRTVPSGTTITDTTGNQFITQAEVSVEPSSYSGNTCTSNKPSASVNVVAAQSGGQFNLSARSYAVSGFSTITAKDSAGMGGGTSKVITVVSNEDIEAAKKTLTGKSKASAQIALVDQLGQTSLMPIEETFVEGTPAFTFSAAVDAEVADVTVSAVTTYTMLGVNPEHMTKYVEKTISSKITDSQQKILDNGINKKTVQLVEKKSPTEQKVSVVVISTVGPDINTDGIASEVAGKTRGEIQSILSQRAGIKDVTVTYNPFWVTSTPKKASKITIQVEQVNANK